VDRGASVRLIGDDQQLAAIGAGGVLRDIAATHGSVRLTELMRFTEPAEAAATLALRDGRVEAIGFYLDRGRVHVGDMTTMSDDVFQSWTADRAKGLDAIMLAPTRDLVAELNRQARQHRLAGAPTTGQRTVQLADGNEATAGDLVLTGATTGGYANPRATGSKTGTGGPCWPSTTPGACGPNTPRPGES